MASSDTTMVTEAIEVQPVTFWDIVSVTWYCPATEKACEGLWLVDVFPSPKFQSHPSGLPVEASVNVSDSETASFVLVTLIAATGGFGNPCGRSALGIITVHVLE